MSDNNADFNGAGQVNNPTSDNAAQADYNQPYIPQQNDAQMNHPESQPETPAYDQNSAAYTQPAQPAEPAVPAYDPNASAYSQYGQTAQSAQTAQPSYGQTATPAPAYGGCKRYPTLRPPSIPSRLSRPRPLLRYMIRTPHRTTSTVSMASRPSLPNLRSRRTVSRQPRRMTPTTLTPSRITTKRTTDSKATRPRLTTNPPTPSPPTRSSRHTASPSHRPDTPRSRNWQPVCLASSWAASACTTSTWATPARPWHSCC